MWESDVDGKRLTFHLAGINNQNFIMRDDETGTAMTLKLRRNNVSAKAPKTEKEPLAEAGEAS